MPGKAKQAFAARKLKREGKIHTTFTQDGTVFIKETEESEPTEFFEDRMTKLTKTTENKNIYWSSEESPSTSSNTPTQGSIDNTQEPTSSSSESSIINQLNEALTSAKNKAKSRKQRKKDSTPQQDGSK